MFNKNHDRKNPRYDQDSKKHSILRLQKAVD